MFANTICLQMFGRQKDLRKELKVFQSWKEIKKLKHTISRGIFYLSGSWWLVSPVSFHGRYGIFFPEGSFGGSDEVGVVVASFFQVGLSVGRLRVPGVTAHQVALDLLHLKEHISLIFVEI